MSAGRRYTLSCLSTILVSDADIRVELRIRRVCGCCRLQCCRRCQSTSDRRRTNLRRRAPSSFERLRWRVQWWPGWDERRTWRCRGTTDKSRPRRLPEGRGSWRLWPKRKGRQHYTTRSGSTPGSVGLAYFTRAGQSIRRRCQARRLRRSTTPAALVFSATLSLSPAARWLSPAHILFMQIILVYINNRVFRSAPRAWWVGKVARFGCYCNVAPHPSSVAQHSTLLPLLLLLLFLSLFFTLIRLMISMLGSRLFVGLLRAMSACLLAGRATSLRWGRGVGSGEWRGDERLV